MENYKFLTDLLSAEEIKLFETWLKPPVPDPKVHSYKGYNIIPDFRAEAIEYANEKWKIKSGDVFTVSYPKTGVYLSQKVY